MINIRLGTDGLRETVGPETPLKVAALSAGLAEVSNSEEVIVGYDPRSSSPLLAQFAVNALSLAGARPFLVGECSTPCVSFMAMERGAPAVMITASHNLAADNGIKFFTQQGRKLSDDEERSLEVVSTRWSDELVNRSRELEIELPESRGYAKYEQFHRGFATSLVGLAGTVVVDCANGGMSQVARSVLGDALGDRVTFIASNPSGDNINLNCGATDMAALASAVVHTGASMGFAFDGDGDRVQAVDSRGRVLDGDFLIAVLALSMKQRRLLSGDTVVVSRWSNLGLFEALGEAGIKVVDTDVGDKMIAELLLDNDWKLGGEQSGHIILPEFLPTGDGLLVATAIMKLVLEESTPLLDLADRAMAKQPQVARSVQVGTKGEAIVERLSAAVDRVSRSKAPQARVVLRASGTEPIVRVMCQDRDPQTAIDVVDLVVGMVEAELGHG